MNPSRSYLNTAAQTFAVNGQRVDYSTAAFIGGPGTDLLNGTKVEAEGPIVSGILQAEKVKFKDGSTYIDVRLASSFPLRVQG